MKAQQISEKSVRQIVNGRVKQPSLCIIKLYSEMCPKCHALAPFFYQVSEEFPDVYFFALDVDEVEDIKSLMGRSITGVPTLFAVRNTLNPKHHRGPRIKRLEDPEEPHPEMWYHPEDIRNFIQQNNRRFKSDKSENL